MHWYGQHWTFKLNGLKLQEKRVTTKKTFACSVEYLKKKNIIDFVKVSLTVQAWSKSWSIIKSVVGGAWSYAHLQLKSPQWRLRGHIQLWLKDRQAPLDCSWNTIMKFLQDSEDAKAKRKVLGSFMLSWNITVLPCCVAHSVWSLLRCTLLSMEDLLIFIFSFLSRRVSNLRWRDVEEREWTVAWRASRLFCCSNR